MKKTQKNFKQLNSKELMDTNGGILDPISISLIVVGGLLLLNSCSKQ